MIRTSRRALNHGTNPAFNSSANSYRLMFPQFWRLLSLLPTLIVFLGVLSPSNTEGASRTTLTPRLTLSETYDDNLDFVNDEIEDPDSDWITTVAPGLQLLFETPRTNLTMDYEAGLEYYLNDSSRDTTQHNAQLTWNHQLTRSLRCYVDNLFVVSDDPVSTGDGQTEEIAQERETRYRNYGEASLSWQYAVENGFTAGYRNRFFTSDSDDEEESIANEIFLNLENWFVPRFGINLESYGNRTEFDRASGFTGLPTEDFYQYATELTFNYRLQPQRLVYARYRILGQDFDQSDISTNDERNNDYVAHEPALGLNLILRPQTELFAEAGYFNQKADGFDGQDGFSGNLGFTTRINRATIGITGSSGYELDYGNTTNFGFTKFRGVTGYAQYQLTRSISISGSGEYRWKDYDEIEVTEEDYTANAAINYTFRPWLRFFLEGTRYRRESSDNTREFKNFRFIFSLRLEYPWRIK